MECTVANKYPQRDSHKVLSNKYLHHEPSPQWRDYEIGRERKNVWHINKKRSNTEDLPSLSAFESRSIEEQFYQLARKWKRETSMCSLAYDKITNPYYSFIIGLGIIHKKTILKLILQDLEKGEEFWHYALKSITNENPVPKGMVNDLTMVRESWLKWGRDNQLL